MEVKITKKQPINEVEWNALCLMNDNFLQNTSFAELSKFFNNETLYFQVYDNDKLIGGSLFSFWESTKLGIITKSVSCKLTQFGEIIYNDEKNIDSVVKLLSTALDKYLKSNKITTYRCSNFYGNINLLINSKIRNPNKSMVFNIGYVDLKKNDEDLLKSFNRNTKRNIKVANENQLKFELITDIERFLKIEKAVYDKQPGIMGPSFDYIRYLFHKLNKSEIVMAISHDGQDDLAGGFFYVYGKTAYSVFGGAKPNDKGAGHFFYYEFMKYLQQIGVNSFYFGQIAIEKGTNTKFEVGISNFKRGFRCVEIPSESNYYILKPFKNKLWKIMIKIFQKIAKKNKYCL